MKIAYVDTSCIVAAAFAEPSATTVVKRLARFDRVLSSSLLEAELFSALRREGRELAETLPLWFPVPSVVQWRLAVS